MQNPTIGGRPYPTSDGSGMHDNGYGIREYDKPANISQVMTNMHITTAESPETEQLGCFCRGCMGVVALLWVAMTIPWAVIGGLCFVVFYPFYMAFPSCRACINVCEMLMLLPVKFIKQAAYPELSELPDKVRVPLTHTHTKLGCCCARTSLPAQRAHLARFALSDCLLAPLLC